MKKIAALLMIIVLFCSAAYGQTEKEKSLAHYLMVMYGNGPFLWDSCAQSNNSIALSYYPTLRGKRFGFGLNAWYIQEDHTSYYGKRESVIVAQPFLLFKTKYIGLKFGLNIAAPLESESAGILVALLAFEVRLGILDRLYISGNYKSDIFLGLYTADIHYIFNNHLTEVILGYSLGNNEIIDHSAVTYGIDHTMFNRVILRLRGNILFKYSSYGFQAGVGIFLNEK